MKLRRIRFCQGVKAARGLELHLSGMCEVVSGRLLPPLTAVQAQSTFTFRSSFQNSAGVQMSAVSQDGHVTRTFSRRQCLFVEVKLDVTV